MLKVDAIVFWLCTVCFVFWIGLETGIDQTKSYYRNSVCKSR